MHGYYLAVDIGAGGGTRVALTGRDGRFGVTRELPRGSYGESAPSFFEALNGEIEETLRTGGVTRADLVAIGVAAAGILAGDGTYQLAANLPFLNGHSVCDVLSREFGVPAAIDNDANAGGLAEWSAMRVELLYWVFGGGWGGAWISKDGTVMHPSHDWDGRDESLHPTNEPGYSIPLAKATLSELFFEVGGDYRRFAYLLEREENAKGTTLLLGPSGDRKTIRAEVVLSGPGRFRLFHALNGNERSYAVHLDESDLSALRDGRSAGAVISRLSSARHPAAINTDRLYGKALAHAARYMIERARADGLGDAVPICLGGRPSYALPYFGPSTQRFLGRFGLMNYMRPSVIDERGLNANLVGAAILAERAAGGSP